MAKKNAPPKLVRQRLTAEAVRSRALDARKRKPQLRKVPSLKIDAFLKGLATAAEPPIDNDPANLDSVFFAKLNTALSVLSSQGTPFKFVEGFRTTDRQQWLYGSGRPTVTPYGRPGPILTNANGVTNLSKHQGTGTPGTGKAADCYPLTGGKVYIPPSSDPVWEKYAKAVEAQGLIAGHHFSTFTDSPHAEMA